MHYWLRGDWCPSTYRITTEDKSTSQKYFNSKVILPSDSYKSFLNFHTTSPPWDRFQSTCPLLNPAKESSIQNSAVLFLHDAISCLLQSSGREKKSYCVSFNTAQRPCRDQANWRSGEVFRLGRFPLAEAAWSERLEKRSTRPSTASLKTRFPPGKHPRTTLCT